MLMLALFLLSACTDVDTCYEADHPHRTSVKFDFDWSAANHNTKPDSMFVLANRVINHWKCAVAVSTTTLKGQYLFNAPENPYGVPEDNNGEGDNPSTDEGDNTEDTPAEGDNAGDTPAEGGGEGSDNTVVVSAFAPGDEEPGDTPADGDNTGATRADGDEAPVEIQETDEFKLRTGEYKFLAFNLGSHELVNTEIMDFLADEDQQTKFQDVSIEYKTYDKNDPKFLATIPLTNWEDYNPYANFMISDMRPVLYDTTVVTPLLEKTVNKYTFKPKPVTQHVTINMQIQKKQNGVKFRVDSVWAEMAGVPHKVNLSQGYIDILKTFKMMFKYSLVDDGGNSRDDTFANTASVKCRARINVPTIVSSSSASMVSGPGVMQVLIYTSTETGERKKFQGKINLYNSLKAAELYKYTSDRQHVVRNGVERTLNVNANLIITGSDILESPDNNGGIDRWIPCGDISMDI